MGNRNTLLILLLILVALLVAAWWIQSRYFSSASYRYPNSEVHAASHTRAGPSDIYPDRTRTPGVLNPDITQDTIRETICNPRWSTRSIRPPSYYTHELKIEQIREYGYPNTMLRDYEEDHLIPLELGGNPSDPRNLWPEPFATSVPDGGARFKDKVENYLHAQVCAGSLTLEQAQQDIAQDWYRVYTDSVPH